MVSPLICYFNESKNAAADLIQYAGMTQVNALTARNITIGEKTLDKGQFSKPQKTAYGHGAAMMVSREVIEKAGIMFKDFFLYYEELDWCERIRRAGFDIWGRAQRKDLSQRISQCGSPVNFENLLHQSQSHLLYAPQFWGIEFLRVFIVFDIRDHTKKYFGVFTEGSI